MLHPLQHGFRNKMIMRNTIAGIYKRHHQKHGKRPADRYLYTRSNPKRSIKLVIEDY